MSFRQILFLSAALLALSVGHVGAQSFTQEDLVNAINQAASADGTTACNPFVDVGCHVPVPDTPVGCTDCAPGQQLSDFLARDGTIVLPNDLTVDGTEIEILPHLDGNTGSIFSIPAQVGY